MIVLKIILFILLAILGIILLLLVLPVGADISFIGEKLGYSVKYAGIKLLDSEGKGLLGGLMKKSSPNEEKAEENKTEESESSAEAEKNLTGDSPDERSDETPGEDSAQESSDTAEEKDADEKKKKKTLGEKVGFVIDIWNSAKRPLGKLLKGFHFKKLYIDFVIADEDAHKCAVNYGRVCTVLYNVLALFARLFTVKYKTVDVNPGFAQSKSRWDISFSLSFRPITAVIAGIWFLITYIFRVYLPKRKENRKSKKTAEVQNTQPQGGM